MRSGKLLAWGAAALVCASVLASAVVVHADDWPGWRGPEGNGHSKESGLPTQWDAKTNVLWQVDVPGRGWSSPIIWSDRVFITAVLNDKTPMPRKGLYIQDLVGKIARTKEKVKLEKITIEK